jgi:hypothetical protein
MTAVRIEVEVEPGADERQAFSRVSSIVDHHGCRATNTRGELWPRSRGRTLLVKIDGPEDAADEAVGEILSMAYGHL